jgi:hypothetical protein
MQALLPKKENFLYVLHVSIPNHYKYYIVL